MRKLTLLSVTCAFFLVLGANAQQDPQFTQFMYDRLSVNPGFAGANESFCATILGRRQWSGFKGAPSTGLLNLSGPISSINSGVGLSVFMDEIGQYKYTQARLSYAYHLRLGGATKLGLGVSLGMVSGSVNPNWVAYDYDGNSLIGIGIGAGDPSIPQIQQTESVFDASFGAYLYNPKWYVGLSSTHLNTGDLTNLNIDMARHYYLMAGYDFALSSQFTLQPNVLAKTDGASTQLDLNANVVYDNAFWLGVTYRLEDAIAPIVGYQHTSLDGKNTLRIGYSYDFTTSQIQNFSSGSHELLLSYCFKIEKPLSKRVYKNVRFL